MSVLARYRKPGGFIQLLKLIETSQPVKQKKLLDAVAKEDPQWAKLLEEKKLTPDLVLNWEPETLVLVFERMIIRHVAAVAKKMDEEKFTSIKNMLKPKKYHEIKEIMEEMDQPLETEYISACNHLLETVRVMDQDKVILLRFIDPILDTSEAA